MFWLLCILGSCIDQTIVCVFLNSKNECPSDNYSYFVDITHFEDTLPNTFGSTNLKYIIGNDMTVISSEKFHSFDFSKLKTLTNISISSLNKNYSVGFKAKNTKNIQEISLENIKLFLTDKENDIVLKAPIFLANNTYIYQANSYNFSINSNIIMADSRSLISAKNVFASQLLQVMLINQTSGTSVLHIDQKTANITFSNISKNVCIKFIGVFMNVSFPYGGAQVIQLNEYKNIITFEIEQPINFSKIISGPNFSFPSTVMNVYSPKLTFKEGAWGTTYNIINIFSKCKLNMFASKMLLELYGYSEFTLNTGTKFKFENLILYHNLKIQPDMRDYNNITVTSLSLPNQKYIITMADNVFFYFKNINLSKEVIRFVAFVGGNTIIPQMSNAGYGNFSFSTAIFENNYTEIPFNGTHALSLTADVVYYWKSFKVIPIYQNAEVNESFFNTSVAVAKFNIPVEIVWPISVDIRGASAGTNVWHPAVVDSITYIVYDTHLEYRYKKLCINDLNDKTKTIECPNETKEITDLVEIQDYVDVYSLRDLSFYIIGSVPGDLDFSFIHNKIDLRIYSMVEGTKISLRSTIFEKLSKLSLSNTIVTCDIKTPKIQCSLEVNKSAFTDAINPILDPLCRIEGDIESISYLPTSNVTSIRVFDAVANIVLGENNFSIGGHAIATENVKSLFLGVNPKCEIVGTSEEAHLPNLTLTSSTECNLIVSGAFPPGFSIALYGKKFSVSCDIPEVPIQFHSEGFDLATKASNVSIGQIRATQESPISFAGKNLAEVFIGSAEVSTGGTIESGKALLRFSSLEASGVLGSIGSRARAERLSVRNAVIDSPQTNVTDDLLVLFKLSEVPSVRLGSISSGASIRFVYDTSDLVDESPALSDVPDNESASLTVLCFEEVDCERANISFESANANFNGTTAMLSARCSGRCVSVFPNGRSPGPPLPLIPDAILLPTCIASGTVLFVVAVIAIFRHQKEHDNYVRVRGHPI